jgi:hypothetical protein
MDLRVRRWVGAMATWNGVLDGTWWCAGDWTLQRGVGFWGTEEWAGWDTVERNELWEAG